MKAILFFISLFILPSAYSEEANELLSFHFDQFETKKVLKHLAAISNQNIIISDQIKDTLTLDIQNMSWKEAFNLILAIKNLSTLTFENAIYVAPFDEINRQQKSTLQFQELQAQYSPLKSRLIHLRYSKASDILQLIKEKNHSLLSKRGNITQDFRSNTLWIEDYPEKLDTLSDFIEKIDQPIRQVQIEARIISVNDHYEKELGISIQAPNHSNLSGLILSKLGSSPQLDLELQAMEEKQIGKIIAKPTLITSDQHTALIESGEEIPYHRSSTKRGASQVAFKKAVLSLEVTPQIASNDSIVLGLKINQNKRGQLTDGVPSIDTQQVATQVLAKNGETIVLGGIYEYVKAQDKASIPLISNVPLLGDLLSRHYNATQRKELIIFITPKVISVQTLDNHFH